MVITKAYKQQKQQPTTANWQLATGPKNVDKPRGKRRPDASEAWKGQQGAGKGECEGEGKGECTENENENEQK